MNYFDQCKVEFLDINGGKLDDKDFFKIKGLSNSKLKLINPAENGSVELYLTGVPFEYNPSLEVGTAIHNLVLESDDYELNDYEGKPAGKCGLFIDYVYKNRRKNIPLYQAIDLASEKANYYSGKLSPKLRQKAIKSGIEYYLKRLHGDFDKRQIVLPKTQLDTVKQCVKSLKNNASFKELYNEGMFEKKEFLNEYALYSNLKVTLPEGECNLVFKGKLDSVIIDHEHKTIHLIDLKTTSRSVDYFMDTVIDDKSYNGAFGHHHYWRQIACYFVMLQMYADLKLYLSKYDIKCHIIVVETTGMHKASVFHISNSYVQAGIKEFKELVCRVAWHEINGYDREFPENV